MTERRRWEKPTPDSPFFKDYNTPEEFLNSPLFESYKPNHHLCSRLPPELCQESIKSEVEASETESKKMFTSMSSSTSTSSHRETDPDFQLSDESSHRKSRKRRPEEEPITIPIGPAPQHPYSLRSRSSLRTSTYASDSPSTSPPTTPTESFTSLSYPNKQQKLSTLSSPHISHHHKLSTQTSEVPGAISNASNNQKHPSFASRLPRFHLFDYEIIHKPQVIDPQTQKRRNLVYLKKVPKQRTSPKLSHLSVEQPQPTPVLTQTTTQQSISTSSTQSAHSIPTSTTHSTISSTTTTEIRQGSILTYNFSTTESPSLNEVSSISVTKTHNAR